MHKIPHPIATWLKMQLYQTLFYSEYGAVVWCTSAQNYTRVNKFQKKVYECILLQRTYDQPKHRTTLVVI